MKVFSLLAVALVLATAVTPTAACCFVKSSSSMSAMHVSMPCCNDRCRMTASTKTHDNDASLTPTTSIDRSTAVAAVTIALIIPSQTTDSVDPVAYASPPSFLAQHQFRI